MDCCNYMQYRHHRPYYGYYDPTPAYHGDFYAHQMYPEYYANSHYYPPQQYSFPDYVYNPKEARIRKAMRDATRERSIGTSPMLSRPNARRASSQGWVPPHEDLMMASPMCGGFPLSPPPAAGGGHFPMSAYTKLEAAPPPLPPPTGSVHTNYLQSNPLAQLQQHAEMWPDYQTMKPRSSGNPFMMGDVTCYSGQNSVMGTSLILEKQATSENSSPDGREAQKEQESENFLPVFEQTDDAKIKQIPSKKPTNKPLPDFNEAFGSTERGRFQSPPDPRLAPNKGYLDYFFESAPIKFDDYQI